MPDAFNQWDGAEEKGKPLALLDPRAWTNPAPPRRWIVQDWVPVGVVTALYGDGGIGKSLAAQQLMTSVATGAPWFGLDVSRGRTLGVFCEDDEDELHRRQEAINESLGITMAGLGDLRLLSRLGEDNSLVQFDGGPRQLTQLHADLLATCEAWRPDLVILDTAADLYPDNESDRSKVRWFVQTALASIARKMQCGLVLLAHPSVAGMASGEGTGGSTAWNNTVRSRMYLSRAKGEDADPDARELSRKKANYAPRDALVRLTWRAGVLTETGTLAPQLTTQWDAIGAMFDELDRAWNAGAPWSNAWQSKPAGRYFPVWMRVHHGIREKEGSKLLTEWMANGYLSAETYDTHSKTKGLKVLRRLRP